MIAKKLKGPININNNSFDLIRIFCTYIVFLGHFVTHFEVNSKALLFISYIVRAVPVFFFFSGFFTAGSLEKYSTKEFYIRRFFRIYPAMWLCIIINTIIILFTYSFFPSFKDFLIYIGSQFTVGQFYTGDWLRGYGVGVPNGALWTISSDIQFYLIAVLLAKFMKNKSLKFWLISIFAFALSSIMLAKFESKFPESIYKLIMVVIIPYMYIFLSGMMVFYFKDKLIPLLAKNWIPISIVYLVWNVLPEKFIGVFQGVRYNVVTTILLLCLVVSVGFAFGKHRVKNDNTYGFYLYHMVIINVIYQFFIKRINNPFIFLSLLIISSVAIFILAFLSQKFIDKKLGTSLQTRVLNKFCITKAE